MATSSTLRPKDLARVAYHVCKGSGKNAVNGADLKLVASTIHSLQRILDTHSYDESPAALRHLHQASRWASEADQVNDVMSRVHVAKHLDAAAKNFEEQAK